MDIIKDALFKIVEDKESPIRELTDYFKKNPWPQAMSKEQCLSAIDLVIESKLPPGNPLVDLLSMEKKVIPRMNKTQLKWLEQMKEIIVNSEMASCDHKDIGIAPFLHGGGFTPGFAAVPELICPECGLNVTLFSETKLEDIGLEMSKEDFQALTDWAKGCYERRSEKKVLSSSIITDNPVSALTKSPNKWKGILPTITNLVELGKKSGV